MAPFEPIDDELARSIRLLVDTKEMGNGQRRDGQWRISHHCVIDDWGQHDEIEAVASEIGPGCLIGTSDRSDPSHEVENFMSARKSG